MGSEKLIRKELLVADRVRAWWAERDAFIDPKWISQMQT